MKLVGKVLLFGGAGLGALFALAIIAGMIWGEKPEQVSDGKIVLNAEFSYIRPERTFTGTTVWTGFSLADSAGQIEVLCSAKVVGSTEIVSGKNNLTYAQYAGEFIGLPVKLDTIHAVHPPDCIVRGVLD